MCRICGAETKETICKECQKELIKENYNKTFIKISK
jgi:hypothetical protein